MVCFCLQNSGIVHVLITFRSEVVTSLQLLIGDQSQCIKLPSSAAFSTLRFSKALIRFRKFRAQQGE